MMLLDSATKSLEIELGAAVSTDWSARWTDKASGGFTPGALHGNSAVIGTVTVVAAPAAATQRLVGRLSVTNRSTTANQTVRVKTDVSGTEYSEGPTFTLRPGESLQYIDGAGFAVLDASGLPQQRARAVAPIDGYGLAFYKAQATTFEAIGVWGSLHAAPGVPGAWAPGTPGVNGRVTDGTAAADAGCLPVRTPASGSNYLVGLQSSSSVIAPIWWHDVLWVNSGLVVTTTTAQAIVSPAWPARDAKGLTEGHGVQVGILVTTATTNAAAFSNATLQYTNQAGTAGRTGTLGTVAPANFPATAAVGTLVWFRLQDGDTGVRSIQSVTLGTSLVAGAISLIASVIHAVAGAPVVNVPAGGVLRSSEQGGAGVRLYPGVCLLPALIATATTALSTFGVATIEVR